MKGKRLIAMCFFVTMYVLSSGQTMNKLDVFAYQKIHLYNGHFPEEFRNDLGVLIPTVLGNLQYSYGSHLGFLYSGSAMRYQPGVVVGHNIYTANDRLLDMYENFKFTTLAVAFVNKINFIQYGHSFVPYAKMNVYLNRSKLQSDQSSYNAPIEPGPDPYTTYDTQVNTSPIDLSFLSTGIEFALGIEIKLTYSFFLFSEFSLSFTDYPDFDDQSPFLYQEGNMLFGINYKILKDKRYYNRYF